MREIKFRAWDNIRDEGMMEVTEISWDKDGTIDGLLKEKDGDDTLGRVFLNMDVTVDNNYREHYILMQFTGLKDKNGTEIYEGDVIKSPSDYTEDYPQTLNKPRLVEMQNGCWCFNAHRHGYLDRPDYILFGHWTASNEGSNILKQIEVIGNIYENPEVLDA